MGWSSWINQGAKLLSMVMVAQCAIFQQDVVAKTNNRNLLLMGAIVDSKVGGTKVLQRMLILAEIFVASHENPREDGEELLWVMGRSGSKLPRCLWLGSCRPEKNRRLQLQICVDVRTGNIKVRRVGSTSWSHGGRRKWKGVLVSGCYRTCCHVGEETDWAGNTEEHGKVWCRCRDVTC